MSRVNILKKIKVEGRWVLRSIPKRDNGNWDWSALPDGRYSLEWYEAGQRRREYVGLTIAQATEAHRRKRHEMEGVRLGFDPEPPIDPLLAEKSLHEQIEHYLRQIETLKKPNTHRKYDAVRCRAQAV